MSYELGDYEIMSYDLWSFLFWFHFSGTEFKKLYIAKNIICLSHKRTNNFNNQRPNFIIYPDEQKRTNYNY
jgi:hypothetical protein